MANCTNVLSMTVAGVAQNGGCVQALHDLYGATLGSAQYGAAVGFARLCLNVGICNLWRLASRLSWARCCPCLDTDMILPWLRLQCNLRPLLNSWLPSAMATAQHRDVDSDSSSGRARFDCKNPYRTCVLLHHHSTMLIMATKRGV
jgi:hypothetical protein